MLREFRGPKAEAIVMFCGKDQFLHAGGAGGADDLLRVERSRVENAFRLVAIAPLLVGESIHGEMKEADEFHLLPRALSRAGHRPERRGGGRGSGFGR